RINAQTLTVVRAGGDGTFGDGNEVAVPIDPTSIKVQPLGTAGGAETISFSTVPGALANDLYRVTLGGGTTPSTDIAGNTFAGGAFVYNFIIFEPTLTNVIFVDASNTFGFQANGSRSNPFPTITQGLAAANSGDIVAVLPGVYTENIALKALVRLVSADPTST